tara:strand:- start:68 stop:601 length:534 start_codon:yes stop_codon:yes gene_type:complete
MKIIKTPISDLIVIEPKVFTDERGSFFESFNQEKFFSKVANVKFVQDNHSISKLGVLRGIHLQKKPFEQGKLVRVIKGEIYDIAVDLRKGSATYLQYFGINLSSENKLQLWIPEGFGHGFLTLSKQAEVAYKATNYYSKKSEVTIKYNDIDIGIEWPGNKKFIISNKDMEGISSSNL